MLKLKGKKCVMCVYVCVCVCVCWGGGSVCSSVLNG